MLRHCAWILGCCFFVVWRPLLGQGQLPAQTELIEICSRNDYPALEKLLNQHSKNAVQAWLTRPVIGNDYPLHACARRGCTEVVERLLAHGADPNRARTSDGATALYIAAQNDHLEVVERLLAHGAKPNRARTRLYATTPGGFARKCGGSR